MQKKGLKNLLNNQMTTFLVIIYIVGFLFGIFSNSRSIELNPTKSIQPVKAFLNVFCMHYWYFFVIWLMGLCTIGFLINVLINFFRGYIFACFISSIINLNFISFLLFMIVEIAIFLPTFIYLLYLSMYLSLGSFFNAFTKRRVFIPIDIKKYQNAMAFITLIIAIYSIIIIVI